MKNKRSFKELLKNNFISVILVISIICIGAVLAGNVIVKEGAMDLSSNLNVSGNAFINGNLGIGSPSTETKINVVMLDDSNYAVALSQYSDSYTTGPYFAFQKSHQDTLGNAQTIDGERLGEFQFRGNTGSGYGTAGYIRMLQDGSSSTTIPGALTFWTSDGTNSAVERLRINKNGNVGIGTTNPSSTLDVVGNVSISQLLKLSSITLPSCTAGLDGNIGRNSTGIYYCNSTTWRQFNFLNLFFYFFIFKN